jgi:hypothetical protein
MLKGISIQNKLVTFTSKRPFGREDSEAWWLCYDTLRFADRELREVATLLRETPLSGGKQRQSFAAEGVAGVDDPARLTKYIPTKGWTPVDTQVRVGDVAGLVLRLGGKELYGDDLTVPLRELIQNAADAVRARRIRERRAADWGQVTVRVGNDTGNDWLEVEDTGIGMSESVLTGPLVDFGTSYWGSDMMAREHPGLLEHGFEASGKYGIGFFSAFMLGERVRITSRSVKEGSETQVLEFRAGPGARPMLRPAEPEERLNDPGTVVRVWLERPLKGDGGLLSSGTFFSTQRRDGPKGLYQPDGWNLKTLCGCLAPALDVSLFVADTIGQQKVSHASDWQTLPGSELLSRVAGYAGTLPTRYDPRLFETLGKNVREIRGEQGELLGRACLRPAGLGMRGSHDEEERFGVVVADGFRTGPASGVAGILLGRTSKAARDTAEPIIPSNAWSKWLTEQAKLLAELGARYPRLVVDCAVHVWCGGGEPGDLPMFYTSDGILSQNRLIAWATGKSEIGLVMGYLGELSPAPPLPSTCVQIGPLAYFPKGNPKPSSRTTMSGNRWWNLYGGTTIGAAVYALAQGWEVTIDRVLAFSELPNDRDLTLSDTAIAGRNVHAVIRRPQ